MNAADGTPPSRLGFGVSGPHATPLVPARDTIALIEEAIGLGVTVFDSGPSYGAGEAERRLGRALRGAGRGGLIVTTKAGVTTDGFGRKRRDFRPEAVRRSLGASLARLGRVDGVWLHGPRVEEITPALLEAVAAEAAPRFIGAAGRDGGLLAALDDGRIAAVMAPVGAHLAPAQAALAAGAAARGAPLFGIEGLAAAAPDRRGLARPADLFYLARAAVRAPAARTLSAADALAAALATEGLTCLLVATTRAERLRENVAQAARLDRADGAT